MAAKYNTSLIITGMVIALFAIFIVLAVFFDPVVDTSKFEDPEVAKIVDSLGQMVWWTTVALVMLPIMLILIVIAGYLFISAAKLTAAPPATTPIALAPAKKGFLGTKPAPVKAGVNEASTPYDILDLRYARGEITRDQYLAMKADMKSKGL